jgi:hypothetical protein
LLPPIGGGGGSIGPLIITSEIELSRIILETSGLMYFLLDIFCSIPLNCKEIFSEYITKILF